jgi:hypothetical protein
MEHQHGQIVINHWNDKLITTLQTLVENGGGMSEKEPTNHAHLLDAFRISLMFWH